MRNNMDKHEIIMGLKGLIRTVEQCDSIDQFEILNDAEHITYPDPYNEGGYISHPTGHENIYITMRIFKCPI